MGKEQTNAELMQTLDDAWNAQDVETFRKRHKDNVVVTWPGGAPPTVGIEDHVAESVAIPGLFRLRRLDLLHRAFPGNDVGADEGLGRQGNPAYREVI